MPGPGSLGGQKGRSQAAHDKKRGPKDRGRGKGPKPPYEKRGLPNRTVKIFPLDGAQSAGDKEDDTANCIMMVVQRLTGLDPGLKVRKEPSLRYSPIKCRLSSFTSAD